jgi:hypothetical protein
MLKRVSFFDFVQGSDHPLGCLGAALDRMIARHKRGLSGSLLVLPEAFNLGKLYYSLQGTPNAPGGAGVSAEAALAKLKELAAL